MRTHIYGCVKCGEKDPANFYGHQKIVCKNCRKIEAQERLRMYKQQLVDYAGGKCQICGYNKSLAALHFHHRNPEEKDIDYEKMKNWSFASRKNEIDKCILVCHNCHAEIHDKRLVGNEPTTPMPLFEEQVDDRSKQSA